MVVAHSNHPVADGCVSMDGNVESIWCNGKEVTGRKHSVGCDRRGLLEF